MIQNIYELLYCRILLLNYPMEEIYNAYSSNETDVNKFLNMLKLVLNKEPDYIFYDISVVNNIFKILGYFREKCEGNSNIIDKINTIIRKINHLIGNDYNEKRLNYFKKQIKIRTSIDCKIDNIDEELIDSLKKSFYYDYQIFEEYISSSKLNINNNNIISILESISYYTYQYKELLQDEEFVEFFSTVNKVIKEILKRYGTYDKYTKQVSKNINRNLLDYSKKNQNNKIKKKLKEINNNLDNN